MNAIVSSPVLRWLLVCLLAISCLPLVAAEACAGPSLDAGSGTILHANVVWEFASDRSRMIQMSLVIVALGCAVMWWYR